MGAGSRGPVPGPARAATVTPVENAAGALAAMAVLGTAGVVLARRGLLDGRAVEALKVLITRLALPLLLLRAFLELDPGPENLVLAGVVFAACAVMAGVAAAAVRLLRLPSPETRLLFQGFEAGMLGYALFAALHTSEHLPAFAALDLGQVVYVFTVLLAQMTVLERRRVVVAGGTTSGGTTAAGTTAGADPASSASGATAAFPWRAVAGSTVLWAIAAGLAISLLWPALAGVLTAPDGAFAVVFDTVGGLTTPLVCLVIGASLAEGIPRDRAIVTIVAARTLVGLGLGLAVGLVVVPALGFSAWHTKAAIMLFLLPAPFVIPVYYRRNPALVGSVLTLGTAVSIVLIAVLAVVDVV